MTDRILKTIAWLTFVAIILVTVSPIQMRPQTITTVGFDRAAAFAVCSAAFVLAYPRYWIAIIFLAVLGAMGLETLQYLSPTRHPHISDAVVKAVGAVGGAVAGHLVFRLKTRPASPT